MTNYKEDTTLTINQGQDLNQGTALDDRVADSSTRYSALRIPFVMPVAAVLTVGLMLSMSKMIATEFTPQDKSENYSFQINPVDEIDVVEHVIDEPDPYEEVEIPPAAPKIATDNVDAVQVADFKVVSTAPILTLPPIEIGTSSPIIPDKDAQPIVRIPPSIPARFLQGNTSGYCKMQFNVSAEGQPYDVVATNCTHSLLERSSKKAVLRWRYTPKIQDGNSVARHGVETRIRFDLADESGKKLPFPSGY